MVWVLLLLSAIPHGSIKYGSCELIELNHFHSIDGNHNLDQIIFYNWNSSANTYEVLMWIRWGKKFTIPPHRWENKKYAVRWKEQTGSYVVEANSFIETTTFGYDPEAANREIFPCDRRKGIQWYRK